MGNPVWPAAKVRARAGGAADSFALDGGGGKQGVGAGGEAVGVGGEGEGEEGAVGIEGQEEAAYRWHVVKRLPGLLTLDCTDVTDEERARAKKVRAVVLSLV